MDINIKSEITKVIDIEMKGISLLKERINASVKNADFVSLNCDLNPTSYRIMSKKEFSLMNPSAYIVNIARGPLINEPDLMEVLKEKRIAGAALDVFEVEPLPTDSPLRGFDNVMLAPHNANSSPIVWERIHKSTVNNLLEELK
ncbi:MAG: NAD(P)-dependent oxidoreductase [Planctomycetota bacterium]|jgi:D-3-phosphoglycerate dehydrogenase